jgi:hypothetical protein
MMTLISENWKDLSTYPNTEKYLTSQWAWEFLRRREDYQKDWLEFYDSVKEMVDQTPLLEPYINQSELIGGIGVAANLALNDLQSTNEKLDFLNKVDPQLKQFECIREINKKSSYQAYGWMLQQMLNPSKSINDKVSFAVSPVTSELGTERKRRLDFDRLFSNDVLSDGLMFDFDYLNEPFQCHLVVDLRFPIGAIKENVLKEIDCRFSEVKNENFKRVNTRVRENKYLTYLRILDAKNNNASNDEIGNILFPRQFQDDIEALRKQVHNTITAAKNAQENYFEIYASTAY